MYPHLWLKVWLLWVLATAFGVSLGLMLPAANPLLLDAPLGIAVITGLLQALVMGYLRLLRHTWLWVVVTGAGGCLHLWIFVWLKQAVLGGVISGCLLGLMQVLLLQNSPCRQLRWTSTQVLWVIVTGLSYGLGSFWVIYHQGVGGENPSWLLGLSAGGLAGTLKGAVLASLVASPSKLK